MMLMPKQMRRSLYIGVAILVVLFVGLSFFVPFADNTLVPRTNAEFARQKARFAQDIRQEGALAAYQKFVTVTQRVDASNQHLLAHLFGEALYDQLGVVGLSVCDNSFVFGCYHSFLGKAIEQQGLAALPKLDAACRQKGRDWLGCLHGMGHGILAFLGYNNQALLSGLAACATLSWQGPVGGCTGGLFMEYNFRTMLDVQRTGAYVRALDANDPFKPCNSLPEQFKAACYYEQPDWLRQVLREDFKKIGALCTGINQANYQEKCLIGLGRTIAQAATYDIGKSKKICDSLGSAKETIFCRAGGLLSLIDYTHDVVQSSVICDLPLDERNACLRQANLFGATTPLLSDQL